MKGIIETRPELFTPEEWENWGGDPPASVWEEKAKAVRQEAWLRLYPESELPIDWDEIFNPKLQFIGPVVII